METILEKISIITPYFETKKMLEKQLEVWHSYPSELKSQIEFVIIDDGSPENPAGIKFCNLNLILARVDINIPWNHPGAQNLGAYLATSSWIWSGGIDHVFTSENMYKLTKLDRKDLKVNYKIPRRSIKQDKLIGYHWEINYLAKKTFWSIGGYDEDFSGIWGSDDVCFTSMLKKSGVREIKLEDIFLDLYTEDDFKDANTHRYTDKVGWGPRKMNPINRSLWLAKVAGKIPYGQNPLRFPWKIEKTFTYVK